MPDAIRLRVSGEVACWTRPEAKVERVSYEVMTPSAARGILDAIMWRPEMRWVIQRIEVLKPIRWISFRRNEVQSKIAPGAVAKWMKDPTTYEPLAAGAGSSEATPRATLALRDVAYVVDAIPIVYNRTGDNSPRKYIEMLKRRVEKGQHHHMPVLGMREFPATVELERKDERPIDESRPLGPMLYDIIFRQPAGPNRALFFNAMLNNGVVNTAPDVIEDSTLREELLACSHKR